MNTQTIESLDSPEAISIFGVQTSLEVEDVVVGAGIPLLLFLVLSVMGFPIFVVAPVVITAFSVGLILVFSAPSYLNVFEFLGTLRYYAKYNGAVDNVATATVAEDTDKKLIRSFKTSDTTRDKTGVKRFYPPANVLERDDGHYVGAIRVDPPNRDFDSREEFAKVANNIMERLNKNIDFEFQFYITTRPFPIEEYISELESRLEDEDIQSKPIMKAILEEKIEKRPDDLKKRGTELPHYYLIASVAPRDIDMATSGTQSPVERLVDIPVIGIVFEIFSSIQSDVEDHQRQTKSIERVYNRLSRLEQAVVRPNEEFESHMVSATEWTELLHTLWTGRNDMDGSIRGQPATTGVPDVPSISERLSDGSNTGDVLDEESDSSNQELFEEEDGQESNKNGREEGEHFEDDVDVDVDNFLDSDEEVADE